MTIVAPLITQYNIKIIKEFNNKAEISIQIGLVMQVLINILKNAIDILVEKNIENPIIRITTEIKKERFIIRIFDNGGGIPDDIFPFIFDKRFTTKGDTDGTGIGLDMSRIGGKLTAHNEDGWAVFNIKIPIEDVES